MAVQMGEAAVATFTLTDAAGMAVENADPTITFRYPDGEPMAVKSGAEVVENPPGVYTAWANTDRAGILSAMLEATDGAGQRLDSEALFVVVDREEERLIQGH